MLLNLAGVLPNVLGVLASVLPNVLASVLPNLLASVSAEVLRCLVL